MNRRTGLHVGVVTLLVVAVLGAWSWVRAGGSDSDAEGLKQRLCTLGGVASVTGGYTQSEDIPFAGSSTFVVDMEAGATPDDVLAVVAAAYDDFDGTFRRDPADLGVDIEGAHIAVHTQGPDADKDDLLEIVRFALAAPAHGETVQADINARDHEDLDELVSEVRLHLPDESTVDEVLPRLEAVQASGDLPADTDFYVLAADGAGLGGSRGLPTEEDVLVWRELNAVEVPGVDEATVSVAYGPYQVYSSMQEFGFANVAVRSPGRQLTKAQVAQFVQLIREILAQHHEEYVYNLTVNGEDRAWMRRTGSIA